MQVEARRRTLAAMGIDVYRLRDAMGSAQHSTATRRSHIVVVCAPEAMQSAAALHLRECLPRALGCAQSRVRWIGPHEADAAALSAQDACLLLDNRTASEFACGTAAPELVAVADAPAQSLRDGLARRALWQALKPLARYVRESRE